MEQAFGEGGFPPFYPTLDGCVARNLRLAAALEESYLEELGAVAAYTYRSMLLTRCEPRTAELFDRIAKEEMMHFRMLGELILALGGDPAVQGRIRVPSVEESGRGGEKRDLHGRARIFSDLRREARRAVDRYQTLMGSTQDRMVRSVLSHLLSDEHRHIEALSLAQKGE